MEASQNPEYLRGTADAVAAFKLAFESFMELHVDTTDAGVGRGLMPAVMVKDGADPAEPLLEASDVLDVCDRMIGRLRALAAKAEAEAPPVVGVEAMHPLVWGAAKRLWRDGHFQEAVAKAAEALVAHLQWTVGRTDVSGTKLWQEVFSDQPAKVGGPRLRWPGEHAEHARTMNVGLRLFAPGAHILIRNPASHGADAPPRQEALEQLAVLSVLARWVDQCDLEQADPAAAGAGE